MRPVPVHPENNGIPPECNFVCRYRQEFSGFNLQKNALRTETHHMVERYRCGWNLKPKALGGHPLDYEPCIFTN